MRHKKKKIVLDRLKSTRLALLKSLAGSLVNSKKIVTTSTKAKFLRPFMEKLISLAQNDTIISRRLIKRYIKQEDLLKKLFKEIAPTFKKNNGGYLKISKLGNRKGDNASLVQIELLKKNNDRESSKTK